MPAAAAHSAGVGGRAKPERHRHGRDQHAADQVRMRLPITWPVSTERG